MAGFCACHCLQGLLLPQLPSFSPNRHRVSGSKRMLDFLLAELRGLITGNPWKKKRLFFFSSFSFSLFPLTISVEGESAINSGGKSRERGALGTFFFARPVEKSGENNSPQGWFFFLFPQLKGSFCCARDFETAPSSFEWRKGRKWELLENRPTLSHTHTMFFCGDETFVLRLNWRVWPEVFCRVKPLYPRFLCQDLHLGCQSWIEDLI